MIEDEPRINLKKTKYRKVSEFLHQYTVSPTNLKSGILVINEVENVQYIDAIIRTHDCWRSLVLNIEDAELFREHVRGDNEGVYWNPSQKHLKGKSSAHSSKDNKIRTRSNMQGENQLSASVATSFNILNTESSEMIDSDDEMNLNRYGHHINKSKKYQFIEAYKVPKNFLSNLFSRCVDTEFGPMLKLNEVCYFVYIVSFIAPFYVIYVSFHTSLRFLVCTYII